MLDSERFGLHPAGHHLSNVLWHILNTLLLFGVLRTMTTAVWRSAMVAALFALHPLHVESVAWVAERKDVLSTCFGLLAIGAYVSYARRPSVGKYLRVSGLLAASLAAKPMLVTLPFLMVLLDVWPLRRLATVSRGRTTIDRRRLVALAPLLVEKIPLLVLVAAICAVTLSFQQDAGAMRSTHVPIRHRAAHATVSYVMYMSKTIWPDDLAVFHPHPYLYGNTPWNASQIAAACGLLLVVCVVTVGLARRRWCPLVGWFWFLGVFVPMIGLVHVGLQGMADRYTYVPLIGLFLVASWGLGDLVRAFPGLRLPACAIAVVILAACAGATWDQVRHWKDTQSLYEHARGVYPDDSVLHTLMGNLQLDRNEVTKAIDHFERATTADPTHDDAWQNLGTAYTLQGRHDVAIGHYHRALAISDDAEGHYALGIGLKDAGRADEALAEFRKSLRLDPNSARTLNSMGVVLASQEQPDAALKCFERAIRVDPWHAATHFNLGATCEIRGNVD